MFPKLMNIPIEVSARHVHLSKDAINALFGKDYTLTPKKALSQPGQFACEERVDIVGPKGALKNVAVLGPARKSTQAEISLTDSRKIGVKGMIRESGDLNQTVGFTLVGPNGEYNVKEGLIIAKRHIHMTPEDAEKLSVKDGEVGKIKVVSHGRSLIYDDVVMRVNENFSLAMHIDTDEANAMNYSPGLVGEVIL